MLCLYRHPTATPEVPRVGLVRADDVVDVHLACFASMAGHMKVRRAHEIATALAPPALLPFLEGGRHSWNALTDSVARLGLMLAPGLLAPTGDEVVVAKTDVRLTPLVPAGTGWSSVRTGAWEARAIALPGSDAMAALYTDGLPYLPEYLAVIGSTADHVDAAQALDAVALVAVVRPSRPESSALLCTVDSLDRAERDARAVVAAAVAGASSLHPLFAGDVVRCGPAMMGASLDIRERQTAPAVIDITAGSEDIVPSF